MQSYPQTYPQMWITCGKPRGRRIRTAVRFERSNRFEHVFEPAKPNGCSIRRPPRRTLRGYEEHQKGPRAFRLVITKGAFYCRDFCNLILFLPRLDIRRLCLVDSYYKNIEDKEIPARFMGNSSGSFKRYFFPGIG